MLGMCSGKVVARCLRVDSGTPRHCHSDAAILRILVGKHSVNLSGASFAEQ